MFDLRYHVASLAAVFLALVIGILVGVGISDPVDNAKTGLLEREVASLQKQLDQQVQQRPAPSPANRTLLAASSTRRTPRSSATGYAVSMWQWSTLAPQTDLSLLL